MDHNYMTIYSFQLTVLYHTFMSYIFANLRHNKVITPEANIYSRPVDRLYCRYINIYCYII